MIVERHIADRTVFAECAEQYARKAVNVLDAFEKLSQTGKPLEAGTQIRFGWSVLSLQDEENKLRVCEPDFDHFDEVDEPRWLPTIDVTLKVLGEQTSLLHRLSVTGHDAFCDQPIIIATGALDRPDVFMRRLPGISESDSGWIVGDVNDPEALKHEENLTSALIGSLVKRRPALLQAITLPPGFIAIFSGASLQQVLDAANRPLL